MYPRQSPGEVLIKHLLEYALARNVAEFDFTIGAEPFKYRFANHVRRVYEARVFQQRMSRLDRAMLETKAFITRYSIVVPMVWFALGRWRDRVLSRLFSREARAS